MNVKNLIEMTRKLRLAKDCSQLTKLYTNNNNDDNNHNNHNHNYNNNDDENNDDNS